MLLFSYFSNGQSIHRNVYSPTQFSNCNSPGANCGTHQVTNPKLPTVQDGNDILGLTYSNSACGLDYVQASVLIQQRSAPYGFNTNGTGLPSQVTISGLPPCHVIEQAYLWFTASHYSFSAPSTSLSITNPASSTNAYSPTIIGISGPKCWVTIGENGTAVYRADVTTSISGNGVYQFDIAGFINGNEEIDGATLMIIYRNTTANYQGSLVLWDGNMTAGNNNGYPATTSLTMTGINACGNSIYANAFMVVSDAQFNVNGGIHTDTLNGSVGTFNNDFYNFDVLNTTVTAGQTSALFSVSDAGDCYCPSLIGLYYRTNCVTCVSPALTLSSIPNATTCSLCNGSATVNAIGGTSPYTYKWSAGGQTTQTATGLCQGTHYVTVTDFTTCNSSVDTVVITAVGGVIASIQSSANVTCSGLCNGSAMAGQAGGTSPYTYTWSAGNQSSQTITGLCAATYTVTIGDATNCTSTTSVIVTEPAVLLLATSNTSVLCNGGNSATATATPTGGTAPFNYSWSNGQAATTASSLTAGTYSITVTDANNCTNSGTVIITEPTALSASTVHTDVICNGGNSGTASVTPSGGIIGYSYSWSNGATTASSGNIIAGGYFVTLTDANGCVLTNSVTITEPAAIALITTSTPTNCSPATGTTSVTPVGGALPYTYLWDNAQITSTVTNLTTGTYNVTVTDNNGCTQTAIATVTLVPGITAGIQSTANVSCNGACNGFSTASVSGGAGPYAYSWSNTQTTATATGFCPATFTVTITDARNCTSTTSVVITEPTVLNSSISSTNVLCNGGNTGTVSVSGSGGTSAYSYKWSNGSMTSSVNVVAGTYTVTVTDAHGCTTSNITTVTHPTPLTSSATHTNNVCNGGNIASATVNPAGGITPYSYLWSNGSSQTQAISLISQTYTVTVTDANGCKSITSAIITQPTAVILSTTSTPTKCSPATGTASASSSGGTFPYSYQWSNGQNFPVAFGLTTGVYTVTVTDFNGCTRTTTATITQVAGVSSTIQNVTNISCNGSTDGSATVVTSGGATPFSYFWSTGSIQPQVSNLSPQTYTITVTDANNCTSVSAVTITEPSILIATAPAISPICAGESTTASAMATGGTPNYSYIWSNGKSGNQIAVSPLGTTFYLVTVTDANGCSSTASMIVNVNSRPVIYAGSDTTIMIGDTALLTATGSGISYSWYPTSELISPGMNSTLANPISTTTYIVYTTDVNGCRNQDTVVVFVDDLLSLYVPSAFTPGNSDFKNDIFYAYGIGFNYFEFYIFDRWGMLIFESKEPAMGWDGTFKGQLVQEDVYVYLARGTSLNGKSVTKTGSVTVVR